MFEPKEYATEIARCQRCPRLRKHCTEIARIKRKSFKEDHYWGRPVPPFGDYNAQLYVLGLAPGAHGANRTGRQFTGDRSGEWLYRALYHAGFSSHPESISTRDGLTLKNAIISCAVKCAPPENKPSREELQTCRNHFLIREIRYFQRVRVFLALGQIAWKSLWNVLMPHEPVPRFFHGKEVALPDSNQPKKMLHLLASYHPSQQNTFTRKLTEPMFDSVFSRAQEILRVKD